MFGAMVAYLRDILDVFGIDLHAQVSAYRMYRCVCV